MGPPLSASFSDRLHLTLQFAEGTSLFFVSGITGDVGGAVARLLLEQGHDVRTLARNPQKACAWSQQGVDLRQGDFNDPIALAGALEAAEGAFLMVPPFITPAPGYPESKATIGAIREALDHATPPRLVVLSSIGSEQASGLGLRGLGAAAATGIFYTFLTPTDLSVPMIATVDVGAEVARLLADPAGWNGKKIIELGTPTSSDDLARAMTEVLGCPVQAQAVPRERWSATCESLGMPPANSWAYEEMSDGINSGWIHFGVPGTETVAGKMTPAEVFREGKPI